MIENQEERTTWPPLLILGNSNCVNLSFYLNHCYTHISKQILEYLLSKQIHAILGCSFDKSVDYDNFAAVNNLGNHHFWYKAYKNLIFYFYVSGNNIHDLLVYCRKYWPKETIPPILHMLEDHADFIKRPLPGHGDYGEHGAESIHNIFRLLQRTYC